MKTAKLPVKKIKDLPENVGLGGVKFRYPGDGKVYYWASQWQKGVWGKKDLNSTQIFPLQVEELKECLEWEVVE